MSVGSDFSFVDGNIVYNLPENDSLVTNSDLNFVTANTLCCKSKCLIMWRQLKFLVSRENIICRARKYPDTRNYRKVCCDHQKVHQKVFHVPKKGNKEVPLPTRNLKKVPILTMLYCAISPHGCLLAYIYFYIYIFLF